MRKHHLRTLEALFAHPLQHGVRVSQVEALFRSLGAEVSERDELLARSRQTLEGLRAENARLLLQIDDLTRERDDHARALATTQRAEEELARQLEAKDEDVMRLSEELRDVAAGLEKAKAQILKSTLYSGFYAVNVLGH